MKLGWNLFGHGGLEKGARLPDGRAFVIEQDHHTHDWGLYLVTGQRFELVALSPDVGAPVQTIATLQEVAEEQAAELFPLQALADLGEKR